jgi:hypothetical protein
MGVVILIALPYTSSDQAQMEGRCTARHTDRILKMKVPGELRSNSSTSFSVVRNIDLRTLLRVSCLSVNAVAEKLFFIEEYYKIF